ncbi:Uncharacterized protein TCM_038123 [Theobroma cacao]|uniref:Integrase catalytic domain-containing protein n=1 Tax=Theobroma cacao TaxID=3641 RepID=A0A061GVH9_THECC|nr:Uncharacterized protein TCM_038123 [Theobroma cacao]
MGCETATQAWNKLQEEFLRTNRTRQMKASNVRREFVLMRLKETQTVKEYINQVMRLVNQIRMLGENLPEVRVVEKILISIPEKFKATIASLEQAKDVSDITVTELVGALEAAKQRRSARSNSRTEVAMTKLAPSDKTQSTENAEVEEETLFMASTDSFYDIDNLEWLIDSGCSNHMTPSEDVFIYFRSRFPLFNSEPTECWTNVGALLYSALQGFGICTIYEPNGNYLMTVPMKNRSFSLNWKETCMQATQSPGTDTELWHKRLEHCNYISLKQLGKMSRKPFPSASMHRAKSKLELIHTDLAGPMSVESLSGDKFYFIFIDDMSRFCWICFLKSKSQVFELFLQFKAKVDLETGHKIKTLRSDNGSEYTSNVFTDYLKNAGIHHQLTAPLHLNRMAITVSSNVTFDERSYWNRNTISNANESTSAPFTVNVDLGISEFSNDLEETGDDIDDVPVRGTRSITDVYHRSMLAVDEPSSFAEACGFLEWYEAMREELATINKNQTWSLVDRPANHHVIGVKWVFKRKLNPDGSVNKHKARLVDKGFRTYAPVARFDTIRLLIALSAAFGCKVHHLDVKSTFLNGSLNE